MAFRGVGELVSVLGGQLHLYLRYIPHRPGILVLYISIFGRVHFKSAAARLNCNIPYLISALRRL